MPEIQLKKLYLAKNMEALNKKVYVDLQVNPEKLLRSSKTLLREAENSDRENDEELAYIYFMRYFSVIKTLQQSEEFKKNKKYYTSILDRRVTKKAIQRAEELSSSLQRRYNLLVTANELTKEESILKVAEEKEKAPKAPKTFPVKDTAITDGFITCEKLFSLTKEKVSSFLVIDVRSKEAFETSSMKISTLINIPEEVLKPGVTADKAGRELDANSRLLWGRRHIFDYIIICDNCTDTPPLHPAIVVLKDAMEKWDPGKSYRANPCVLKGGFEMFSHTYPMMISNPRALFSTTFNSFNNNNDNSFLSQNLSQLNISFPDLNEGFLNTPSPETKLFPEIGQQVAPPQVNRGLKPRATSQQPEMKQEESSDKDSIYNSVSDLQSFDSSFTSIPVNDGKMLNNSVPPSASYNHVPPSRAFGAWLSCSSSSSEEDIPNVRNEDAKKPTSSGVLKGDALPKIPNRNLKPADMLESYNAKNKILDESKKILEMSYNAEKDTLEKLHEIEEAHKSKELSSDEDMQKKLGARESRLRVDLEEKKKRAKEMENEFSEVNLKNEDMSNHLSNISSNHSDNFGLESHFYFIEQMKEKEALMKREEEQKALQKQVELLRKKRKEKEKLMEEQLKREKLERRRGKENEDQKRPTGDRGLGSVEHNRVSDRQSNKSSSTSSKRKPGDTYTTKLKTSPSHSPVRGSGGLRRSHSALNLSQLKDENGFDASSSTSTLPNFDRNLKPFSSPRWRNVQEARLRNFEPKFGSVPATKTGLKNLGNTCYMNSIIQCLSNTHRLATYFFQGSYSESLNPKSNQKGEVAVEFGEVVRALWCCQYRSISMYDLKSVVGRHHKPFQGYDQHDSHEFLIKFMDWLHDDLNKVREIFPKMEEQNFDNVPDDKAAQLVMDRLQERDASIVRTIFYGLHRSVIVCHTCSNRSLTFEPFSVLTLSFPARGRCTLKDMLHEFYKETRIEYRCDSCRRLTNCTRKFDIWRLPPVLIIHLNRFEHDILMKKKQNFVDFPLENLNFTEYLSDPFNYRTYDLYGVSNHYGTIDGGHYTAFCKSPQQAWYKFDDHEVYDISRESVKTSAAYILFYEASESKSAY